jgi:hypothetical protein
MNKEEAKEVVFKTVVIAVCMFLMLRFAAN